MKLDKAKYPVVSEILESESPVRQTYRDLFEDYAKEKYSGLLAVVETPNDPLKPASVIFTMHADCGMRQADTELPGHAMYTAYPIDSLKPVLREQALKQPCALGEECPEYDYPFNGNKYPAVSETLAISEAPATPATPATPAAAEPEKLDPREKSIAKKGFYWGKGKEKFPSVPGIDSWKVDPSGDIDYQLWANKIIPTKQDDIRNAPVFFMCVFGDKEFQQNEYGALSTSEAELYDVMRNYDMQEGVLGIFDKGTGAVSYVVVYPFEDGK